MAKPIHAVLSTLRAAQRSPSTHRSPTARPATWVVALVLAVTAGAVAVAHPAHAAGTVRDDIVSIAYRELGDSSRNTEYANNCSWYGHEMLGWPHSGECVDNNPAHNDFGGGGDQYNWCATFAKYVWREGGATDLGGIDGYAQTFRTYGEQHGTFHFPAGYTPQPGDAIVFDFFAGTRYPIDHVAIVTSASGSRVYTIGGNESGAPGEPDAVRASSYLLTNAHIVGYSSPANAEGASSGTASIYGAMSDGRLTFTNIDGASGERTHGAVVSSASLGFVPVAMATLNFNTILVTSPDGGLYRVDVITNNTELIFEPPIRLGGGWTHSLLAFDGHGHLYGIAGSTLRRYTVNAAKPVITDIANNTVIGTGFTLKTLTATGADWILGTTTAGQLISYQIRGAGDWDRYELRSTTWQVFDMMLSPGGGVYYAHKPDGSMYWYLDQNPYDGSSADLTSQGAVDASGWSQMLLSAQPATVS
ncbi:MAG TPA: CHAP domain-containing protein [Micromonosporaceae bacterium]|jgi:hypothetical protein